MSPDKIILLRRLDQKKLQPINKKNILQCFHNARDSGLLNLIAVTGVLNIESLF